MIGRFGGVRAGRRGIGAAAAALLVSAALLAQGGVATNAEWVDAEWAHAAEAGAVDCAAADGAFATRGEGRALSGSLLGMDLDALLEAERVEATNDGSRVRASQGAQLDPLVAPDAYADPFDLAALDALPVPLTGVLQLDTGTNAGVLAQFGQARSNGRSAGASGYLADDGGINLDGEDAGYPELGSIGLTGLLDSAGVDLGTLVSGVTDVGIGIGAVAGRASLDACVERWSGDLADAVTREYLATSLTTDIDSPTVGALVGGVEGAVDALDQTVNGLAGNSGAINSIVGGVTGLLNGLISNPILSLGGVSATLSATVDTAPVRALLTETITDAGGIVSIDLDDGVVSVDTAALLGAAYPDEYGDGLNGLAPNTDLLTGADVADELTGAVTGALEGWLTRVTAALDEVVDDVDVQAHVVIALQVEVCIVLVGCSDIGIGTISADVDGSLESLLAGGVPATTDTDLNLGLLGVALRPVVNGLVNVLLGGLTSGLGLIVGNAVEGVLGALRTLPASVHALAAPVVSTVSGVYSALFLSGVVQLLVNAQNDPPPAAPGPGPEPPDWSALPAGRYDVAALRVGVLGALPGNEVRLYLGRGSVGRSCTMAEAAAGACSGY